MGIVKIQQLINKKRLFGLQILLNIGFALIMIVASNFAKEAVDQGIGEGQLTHIFIKFIVLIVAGTLLNYGKVICSATFSNHFIEVLRNVSLNRLLTAKYSYYERETTGKISSRMNRDMGIVAEYIGTGMPEFVSNMVIFIFCFIYLFTINPSMTLISSICIPMAVGLAKKVASPTYDTMAKFNATLDEATQMVQDTMNNIKVEKLYDLGSIRKRYFNQKMDQAIEHYVRYEKLVAKAGGYKYVIRVVPMFICIFMGFYNAYLGRITSGEMIAFVLLLQNISKPLSEFTRYITELKEAMVSMDRIMEIINTEEEKFGNEEAMPNDMTFELKDVTFTYEQEIVTNDTTHNAVLSHINMSIPKGKTVALVGQSGSGKSTLFKLLIGFHEPNVGNISLYGKSLKQWEIEKLRRNIAYVAQNTYLFAATIAENIGYGNPNASLDEIMLAAKRAYAHDFIMSLPQGYQTVLSERGSNLSGGQRQRIGIARAFLKDAPIFILDEMTSALDVESEMFIQKAINEYGKTKTVILIAHRLSTVRNADEIYVLDQGLIAEKGSHEQLIAQDGIYSKLYRHQVGEGEEERYETVL